MSSIEIFCDKNSILTKFSKIFENFRKSIFFLNLAIGGDPRLQCLQQLQKPLDRRQSVRFQSLIHRWKRQDQGFLAHIELIPRDQYAITMQLFSENRSYLQFS